MKKKKREPLIGPGPSLLNTEGNSAANITAISNDMNMGYNMVN